MGCLPGVDAITVGNLEYGLTVEPPEQIVVPLGRFTTYVVRYREKSRAKIMGRTSERVVETKWWIAPKLNYWVRRSSQLGDKMLIAEAVKTVDPGQ
jgi:hypothetical protein